MECQDVVRGQVIRGYCDKTAVISYLRHVGGTSSVQLTEAARKLLLWMYLDQVILLPKHFQGQGRASSGHPETKNPQFMSHPCRTQRPGKWMLYLSDGTTRAWCKPSHRPPLYVSPAESGEEQEVVVHPDRPQFTGQDLVPRPLGAGSAGALGPSPVVSASVPEGTRDQTCDVSPQTRSTPQALQKPAKLSADEPEKAGL